jgi:hypothetical protein
MIVSPGCAGSYLRQNMIHAATLKVRQHKLEIITKFCLKGWIIWKVDDGLLTRRGMLLDCTMSVGFGLPYLRAK